jgi:hypothetical protein
MLIRQKTASNFSVSAVSRCRVHSSFIPQFVPISIVIAKDAVTPLFFGLPGCRHSSISAGEERSFADNFLQKQQKQRGHPLDRGGF